MKMSPTRSRVLMAVVLAPLSFFSAERASSAQTKSDYLDRVQRVFGKPAYLTPPLFAVSNDYALRLRVNKKFEITRIDVFPKYGFEELVPSWKEPDYSVGMSEKQFDEILARIGEVKRIGHLINRGFDYVVMNSKVVPVDEYEQGFVRRVAYCCPKQDDLGTVFSFSVIYNRVVRGKVKDINQSKLPDGSQRIKVRINGHWYLISVAEVKKVRLGRTGAWNVAGPVG